MWLFHKSDSTLQITLQKSPYMGFKESVGFILSPLLLGLLPAELLGSGQVWQEDKK